jgi:hypothetical protein
LIAAYSERCTVTALSGVGRQHRDRRPGFVFDFDFKVGFSPNRPQRIL